MKIVELTIPQFDAYAIKHPLGNYYQSSNYALLMAENGFEYDLIGYVDDANNIKAATLILYKKISLFAKYGYAPKGFLIDYYDLNLFRQFTDDLKKYYKSKGIAFIKINPEIAIGEIDKKTFKTVYNPNVRIRDFLMQMNYLKLKDNIYFESMFPRFNAIIPLREFSINSISKNTRNKVKKAIRKGLKFEKSDRRGIDILFNFIKDKKNRDEFYYKDYYNIFNKYDNIDLFLVSLDYNDFMINSRKIYEQEAERNNNLNIMLRTSSSSHLVNRKMNSDKALIAYKNDIALANVGINRPGKTYVAGALVMKYHNRINIVISGFDRRYGNFNPNHFLHYKILEYYKDKYSFADLNGLTGDFTKNNPYHGLNQFKIGFNPKIYEFIGEYDLLINQKVYMSLYKSGALAKEFNKVINNNEKKENKN